MARFQAELPNDLIKEFEELETNCTDMFGEMVEAGAKTVQQNVQKNMKSAFKDTAPLEKGLKKTRVYNTPSDDGVNVHIGFYGYDGNKITKAHPKGVPIPLMAMAREYGTSSGEGKKPFFRKSFKKKEIESAMEQVQEKYIKGE
jgi:hypothetical protein